MSRFFPSSHFSPCRACGAALPAALLAAVMVGMHRLRLRGGDLLLDDAEHLGKFPALNAGRPLWELFLLPHWQQHAGDTLWRPVSKLLWAQIGPETSLLPAITILAAAALSALLAWFLTRHCQAPPAIAILAALIPVSHPLAADVLLPYVGQMDLLAAGALLAAVILLSHPSTGGALAGGFCFAIALLSKESVLPALIALPLAVASVAPTRRKALRHGLRAGVILGAIIAVWFAARAWLFAGSVALGSGGGWYREDERRLSALELLGRYFAAFLDPRTPQTDYSFLKQPGTSAGYFPLIGLAGLAAMIGAAWFLWPKKTAQAETDDWDDPGNAAARRRWRMMAAMVWIVVFLVPYLQFVPIGALWAGRFGFLSLVGVAWLTAEALGLLGERQRWWATVALASLVALGAMQINRRALDWSDALTLWSAEVRRQPDHAFAWNNLGVTLQHAGDPTAALEAARHATELFPSYGESWLTRGRLERAVGDHSAGRASYHRAEGLLGDHLDLQMEIARLDASEGRYEIALARLDAMGHKGAGNPEYEELVTRIKKDMSEK